MPPHASSSMSRAREKGRRRHAAGDAGESDGLAKWLLGLETRILTSLVADETGTSLEAAAEAEIENEGGRPSDIVN